MKFFRPSSEFLGGLRAGAGEVPARVAFSMPDGIDNIFGILI